MSSVLLYVVSNVVSNIVCIAVVAVVAVVTVVLAQAFNGYLKQRTMNSSILSRSSGLASLRLDLDLVGDAIAC
ncbi:hypothetical protein FZEAL_7539 [Fusarium zealandicum]|uniref:Uncharacterized protein n=1 Tax=Fusarium zealandicum TaxID=1053134 RepID=A0A8H4XID6_9HYPO|nr:hypothetical protein FZEAL_7539 [Fusarium zealandicum]